MSFWSTDWQLEAVNGHDQTTHANDGLQLPGRANLDPGVMAGNDVIAPVAGNSVLDRAGELSITPHGSWLQHVPTNDRRNATDEEPLRNKRSIKIKGRRQEGWALPESTGLVSSASVPPMKSNRLSSPFAMPAHHPQQPSNPQPGAKQSKKVKIKLKQPDSSSAAQGVLSHSSLPASFTEAGAAMSQAVQAPAGATMSHGNQALSHANLVNSSAAEHRQTVSSFAAASLPRNGGQPCPPPGGYSAPTTVRDMKQAVPHTRASHASHTDDSPGIIHTPYDDVFGQYANIGPLSPGKFDAAADPEPNKITPEFIDQWYASPRLSDLLVSPAKQSPLQGSGALIAELHQLVSSDEPGSSSRKLVSPKPPVYTNTVPKLGPGATGAGVGVGVGVTPSEGVGVEVNPAGDNAHLIQFRRASMGSYSIGGGGTQHGARVGLGVSNSNSNLNSNSGAAGFRGAGGPTRLGGTPNQNAPGMNWGALPRQPQKQAAGGAPLPQQQRLGNAQAAAQAGMSGNFESFGGFGDYDSDVTMSDEEEDNDDERDQDWTAGVTQTVQTAAGSTRARKRHSSVHTVAEQNRTLLPRGRQHNTQPTAHQNQQFQGPNPPNYMNNQSYPGRGGYGGNHGGNASAGRGGYGGPAGGRGRGALGGSGRQTLAQAREVAAAARAQQQADAEASRLYEIEVGERFLVAKGYFQARKKACALAQAWQRAGQVRERAKQLKTVLSTERRSKDVVKWHKWQQSQKSKVEAARLTALRRQDYSEYLRLAQEAKAGRVQDAIEATENVMLLLTEKVLQQQAAQGTHLPDPSPSPAKPTRTAAAAAAATATATATGPATAAVAVQPATSQEPSPPAAVAAPERQQAAAGDAVQQAAQLAPVPAAAAAASDSRTQAGAVPVTAAQHAAAAAQPHTAQAAVAASADAPPVDTPSSAAPSLAAAAAEATATVNAVAPSANAAAAEPAAAGAAAAAGVPAPAELHAGSAETAAPLSPPSLPQGVSSERLQEGTVEHTSNADVNVSATTVRGHASGTACQQASDLVTSNSKGSNEETGKGDNQEPRATGGVLQGGAEGGLDSLPAHERYYRAVHSVTAAANHWGGKEQPPSLSAGCMLRPYQSAGVRFLFSLFCNGINGILADEMGLGKTVQALALFAAVAHRDRRWGPFLVVAPKAVLPNWVKEARRWLPAACVTVLYDGPGDERKALQRMHLKGTAFNLLLTHYHIAISDRPVLAKIQWEVVVVDEGHRLKNDQSRLAGALAALPTRARFLLTGTPLQNRLTELWALLHFLLPSVFSSAASFDAWFGDAFSGNTADMELSEEEQLLIINRLHAVLRPLMLRRTKAEVAGELPNKIERVVRCALSPWQAALYRNITSSRNFGNARGRTVTLANLTMHLRKVCLHPGLMYDDYEPESAAALVRASGKLALLHNILPKLQLAGHRVLLFSQFTSCLDLIQSSLEAASFPHLRLDGTTKTHERAEALDAFNAPDSPYFLFLLSTRAGGLGLNLQTADTVIIFDQDWNPQMDLQAKDRAHRLGQQKQVMVLVLVCPSTVEEVILEATERKLSLDAKVIQAGLFNEASTAADRQKALQQVLQTNPPPQFAQSDAQDTSALNALISRNTLEQALFDRIDRHTAALAGAPPAGTPPADPTATRSHKEQNGVDTSKLSEQHTAATPPLDTLVAKPNPVITQDTQDNVHNSNHNRTHTAQTEKQCDVANDTTKPQAQQQGPYSVGKDTACNTSTGTQAVELVKQNRGDDSMIGRGSENAAECDHADAAKCSQGENDGDGSNRHPSCEHDMGTEAQAVPVEAVKGEEGDQDMSATAAVAATDAAENTKADAAAAGNLQVPKDVLLSVDAPACDTNGLTAALNKSNDSLNQKAAVTQTSAEPPASEGLRDTRGLCNSDSIPCMELSLREEVTAFEQCPAKAVVDLRLSKLQQYSLMPLSEIPGWAQDCLAQDQAAADNTNNTKGDDSTAAALGDTHGSKLQVNGADGAANAGDGEGFGIAAATAAGEAGIVRKSSRKRKLQHETLAGIDELHLSHDARDACTNFEAPDHPTQPHTTAGSTRRCATAAATAGVADAVDGGSGATSGVNVASQPTSGEAAAAADAAVADAGVNVAARPTGSDRDPHGACGAAQAEGQEPKEELPETTMPESEPQGKRGSKRTRDGRSASSVGAKTVKASSERNAAAERDEAPAAAAAAATVKDGKSGPTSAAAAPATAPDTAAAAASTRKGRRRTAGVVEGHSSHSKHVNSTPEQNALHALEQQFEACSNGDSDGDGMHDPRALDDGACMHEEHVEADSAPCDAAAPSPEALKLEEEKHESPESIRDGGNGSAAVVDGTGGDALKCARPAKVSKQNAQQVKVQDVSKSEGIDDGTEGNTLERTRPTKVSRKNAQDVKDGKSGGNNAASLQEENEAEETPQAEPSNTRNSKLSSKGKNGAVAGAPSCRASGRLACMHWHACTDAGAARTNENSRSGVRGPTRGRGTPECAGKKEEADTTAKSNGGTHSVGFQKRKASELGAQAPAATQCKTTLRQQNVSKTGGGTSTRRTAGQLPSEEDLIAIAHAQRELAAEEAANPSKNRTTRTSRHKTRQTASRERGGRGQHKESEKVKGSGSNGGGIRSATRSQEGYRQGVKDAVDIGEDSSRPPVRKSARRGH